MTAPFAVVSAAPVLMARRSSPPPEQQQQYTIHLQPQRRGTLHKNHAVVWRQVEKHAASARGSSLTERPCGKGCCFWGVLVAFLVAKTGEEEALSCLG